MIVNVLSALIAGVSLRFAIGLEPVWWLAWVAPALLLAIGLRVQGKAVYALLTVAALIGTSVNFTYYVTVTSFTTATLMVMALAALWFAVVIATRHFVLRFSRGWTCIVYPIYWTAFDTLMAAFLPNGNFGNIGYSQLSVLPLVQIAAITGVAGITFIVSLIASALAFVMTFGLRDRRTQIACAAAITLLLCALLYGSFRLQEKVEGPAQTVGLVAIDDAIGLQATVAYAEPIWQQYERHIATLKQRGATIVVLPEKIAVLSPADAKRIEQRFSSYAQQLSLWLEMGIAIDDEGVRRNVSWLISPNGDVTQRYQKHFLAPGESDYQKGDRYAVETISALRYGLAICKDMHFASLARDYAIQQVDVMVVPAWDFQQDRVLANAMTVMRGVENGFTIVRSAREGLLSVSDAYGRIVAQQVSGDMPGATLLTAVIVPKQIPTLYTRMGNWFGWLAVACWAGLIVLRRSAY